MSVPLIMTWLLIAGFVIVFVFGSVLLFGAPYLPTLTPQVKTALELANLQKGQHLLELGCGDGKVLIAAAEQGLHVTGYELNPILAFISWMRTRRYKGQAKVVWGNFWQTKLPPADAIFVFLLPKYMDKLDNKITQEFSNPVKLVSFAFTIPNKLAVQEKNGLFAYDYR